MSKNPIGATKGYCACCKVFLIGETRLIKDVMFCMYCACPMELDPRLQGNNDINMSLYDNLAKEKDLGKLEITKKRLGHQFKEVFNALDPKLNNYKGPNYIDGPPVSLKHGEIRIGGKPFARVKNFNFKIGYAEESSFGPHRILPPHESFRGKLDLTGQFSKVCKKCKLFYIKGFICYKCGKELEEFKNDGNKDKC